MGLWTHPENVGRTRAWPWNWVLQLRVMCLNNVRTNSESFAKMSVVKVPAIYSFQKKKTVVYLAENQMWDLWISRRTFFLNIDHCFPNTAVSSWIFPRKKVCNCQSALCQTTFAKGAMQKLIVFSFFAVRLVTLLVWCRDPSQGRSSMSWLLYDYQISQRAMKSARRWPSAWG